MAAMKAPAFFGGKGFVSMDASLASVMAAWRDSGEIFGFTQGRWSLPELMLALADELGECSIDVSTWTAAGASIEAAEKLIESGSVISMRWLLDDGFKSRQPEYARALVERFGANAIRTLPNHAKFICLYTGEQSVVVKTSMNLNQNPRMENYEISSNPALAAFFRAYVDRVFDALTAPEIFKTSGAAARLDAVAGAGALSDADILGEL